MKFTKMHGIGNDYIYFDCTGKNGENMIKNPEKLSVAMSKYHFAVGADGIVLIMKSDIADFRMRMFNADGSEGKMCGNATRCIGKYVYERGLTDKTEITLETLSGIKYIKLTAENGKVSQVSVDMGEASFKPADVPVVCDYDEFVNKPLTINNAVQNATCVSVGNPHCVIFTDTDIDTIELEKIGPMYENAEIFPERINTEFVNIINKNTLKMRVWERGSGETFACGTGACAVASSAVKCGICKKNTDITVMLKGGNLKICIQNDGHIIMTGPASFVYDGELCNEFIEKENLQDA